MKFELRLSSEAERSIEDQQLWYEDDEKNGGIQLAKRWLDSLQTALTTLAEHPERHGFAPENGRWNPEIPIRQLRFKPWKTPSAWRVLYVVDPDLMSVTVLQIRHEKRPPLF
ncbi:type II toxin-antitoxin system RelE/ParE family toxin [Luteolibacter yonseiensis]|uniref:Type II toxin-antitoxin system RelE/ParE family toxin n=1 Tax=Luteolibacter yonseiensis TaxID=1144680 RepID=A0A934V761_9BACT|nr:type II toxin-antitoxin system RelE/ParE family toxin [Luteolibacter yonseiensis]MBK1815797.1 type II toxin-antitoxin system RelE/ParE family toxin [Luteolibacter yonseiensis]